jgi:hypothetical protein
MKKTDLASVFYVLLFFIFFILIPQLTRADDSPIAPHLLKPEAYSETYTAVLELGEEMHIQIQLVITNIGIGDQFSMCRVLFIDDKDAWNDELVFDRSGWSYDPAGRLEIGKCSLAVEQDTTLLYAEVERGSVQVKLPGSLKPVKPPGHLITAGSEFFDLQILMPWSQVEVRLDLREQPSLMVKGYGCMYHFWVTAWPYDLARQWVRVFGMSADGAFIVMAHYPTEKNEPPRGSVWIPGAPAPVAFDAMQREHTGEGTQILNVVSGKRVHRLFIEKELYRHAPLEDLGFLGRVIRVFIGNWVTRTYRASLLIHDNSSPVQAIVEITDDE